MYLIDEVVRRDEFSHILMEGYVNEILCSTYRLAHAAQENCYQFNDGEQRETPRWCTT